MNTKIFANPYYCYIISFGLALFVYSWSWSEIYPVLTPEVTLFLFSTFGVSLYLGNRVGSNIIYRNINTSPHNYTIAIGIMLGYSLEFIYNGGIPLLLILRGVDVAYMDFGIPTFHVILHTFTCFYIVYTFHQYLGSGDKKMLLLIVILFIPNIMIVNRGAIIMTTTSCLLMYLFSIKKIIVKRLFFLLSGAFIFFYAFGYLGNERSFNSDPNAFLNLTKATDKFSEGYIPKEYYWFYIYASSPFANFQNSTITSNKHRYDISSFIAWELLPDFISKRIVAPELDYDGKNRLDYSINPILTVGSIYFEPFIRMGWYGPVTIFCYYAVIVYLYILLFNKKSKYFISAISILCVISIFNMFENMINFAGLSFQLLYPVILSKYENVVLKNFRIKRVSFANFFSTKK